MGKRLSVVAFAGVVLLFACSSADSASGVSGSCAFTENGAVALCIAYSNVPSTYASTVCPTSSGWAATASCSSANSVGECSYLETVTATTFRWVETTYGVNGATCSIAKSACTQAATGGMSGTFAGNGC